MVKNFPGNLKITLLPKAVDSDENAVVFYNLSVEGLTVFDIDKSTGDITTKISCSQACILTNSTQFEFHLMAYNEADPSAEGDSILIRIRLVERITPPALPGGNKPTTNVLPARGGTSEEPVLSVGEVVAIVVVVCLFLFIVFVIILVLLLRRGSTQRKKDRIDFNPSHHAVRKIENEVP
ncbi:uncharacterized protein LOC135480671 [Liolophura sinensis]|uniref:uncharacterized protein LOC135480671 n=1 Tax=Liolophura sinensis TaxID=3198878 RepID=UPI0031581080